MASTTSRRAAALGGPQPGAASRVELLLLMLTHCCGTCCRCCCCSQYRDERDLQVVMDLIDNELSEPYSIFTYRYFLQQWPSLCYIAYDGDK